MLRIESKDGVLGVACTNRGCGVYLDNDSLIDLAKGDSTRRDRFVSAIKKKGALLFSFTNAMELAGPQGRSADVVRVFLDSLGQYWMPLAMNVYKVMEREQGRSESSPAFSEIFLKGYFQSRLQQVSDTTGGLLGISDESFFRLGSVVGWIQNNRDHVRQQAKEIDGMFRDLLGELVLQRRNDTMPKDLAVMTDYSEQYPARFAFFQLQRVIWNEARAYRLKANDGIDFCHAVVASSYGSIITLDKHWKRRILEIPKSHRLAKTFYRAELDELVDELDAFEPASIG